MWWFHDDFVWPYYDYEEEELSLQKKKVNIGRHLSGRTSGNIYCRNITSLARSVEFREKKAFKCITSMKVHMEKKQKGI